MAKSLHILKILLIFALWIGWSRYHLTRGMSIPPSTSLMIDITKKIDNMGGKKVTKEEFLRRAKLAHGDKYDYTNVVFVDCKTKVEILCKEHGSFLQAPRHHMKGVGCPHCGAIRGARNVRWSKDKFVEISKKVHMYKDYDYSKVEYKNFSTKVCIICPTHGEFWQEPLHHTRGRGCPYCGGTAKKSQNDFLLQAKKVHGDVYDYSKVKYVNDATKVIITCKKHGDFEQIPNVHLKGHGCPYCGNNHKYTTKEYVTIASQTHGNKYNYDKTIYKGSHQKVTITCPIHGDFVLMAYQHLQGCGCSKCRASLGENRIRNFLETNKIEHIGEYKIYNESPFCKNRILYVDFFLTKYNIVIEYNGEQHYKEVPFFIKRRTQKEQQERDNAVRQYCKDHKIKLIEIPYTEYDNIENILKRELKI